MLFFFVISTGNLNDVTERQSPLLVDGMELREAIRARNGLVIVLGELLGDSSFFFLFFSFLITSGVGRANGPRARLSAYRDVTKLDQPISSRDGFRNVPDSTFDVEWQAIQLQGLRLKTPQPRGRMQFDNAGITRPY